jgi:hypothetical protein
MPPFSARLFAGQLSANAHLFDFWLVVSPVHLLAPLAPLMCR